MLKKEEKQELLKHILDKELKCLIGNILDKGICAMTKNISYCTCFLNTSELSVCKHILDKAKIEYLVYEVNKLCDKKNIVLNASSTYNISDIAKSTISCLVISNNAKAKLEHKDYMGSIYNLGVKKEYVGDIFVKENVAYVFCMRSVVEYFKLNLNKVSKYTVKVEEIEIDEKLLSSINIELKEEDIVVASVRVDTVLSVAYGLSRNKVKEKIQKGEMYINSKEVTDIKKMLNENDIVSFRKCGKFVVGRIVKETKSGKLLLNIQKYI